MTLQYTVCICPHCGREMNEYFTGDDIRRVRCMSCGMSYSELEWILRNGETPVRRTNFNAKTDTP